MSLTHCPKCGLRIESSAFSCPACGAAIALGEEPGVAETRAATREATRKALRLHSLGAIALTLVGAILLVGERSITGDTGRSVPGLLMFVTGMACFAGGIAWSLVTRMRKLALEKN